MGSHGKRPFCPSCSKPSRLCLCNRFKNHPIDNSIPITVLQHSHEKNHALNSTRIALLGLKNIVVAPVSDVHFQAQFVIRSIRKEPSCRSRSSAVVGSESGTGKVGFHLGARDFNESLDFSLTQKVNGKLWSVASVVGSHLENPGRGSKPGNAGFDGSVDSLKTQKAIAEVLSAMSAVGSGLGHGNWAVDSFKTKKAIAELGPGASVVCSDLEDLCNENKLENAGFDWSVDSLKTQKAFEELGSGASGYVSGLEYQRVGNLQENDISDSTIDSLETQKAVGESTAVFAEQLEHAFCKTQERNCRDDNEEPNTGCSSNATAADANGSLESCWKNQLSPDFGVLEGGLEDSDCHSNLQCSQTHDRKNCFEKITASPRERIDTDLQSSRRKSSKPVNEQVSVSSLERKMASELDTKTGIAAAVEKGSFLIGPPNENHCKKRLEKLNIERVPVTLTSDNSVSATEKQAILTAESMITDLLPHQNRTKTPGVDQLEGYLTDEEAVVITTISKCGSENASGDLDFCNLSVSPIGRDFISNGFIVKKLQRMRLGDNMEFEEFETTIPPGSALLFPSKKAIGLEAVDFEVKHLIVLDGTWSKAKRMYHENPWLNLLPHLKLDPREMSLYSEVRHQPKAGCLSTIESIVCALKALGEDSVCLDDLLEVFESMVVDQRRCKAERLSELSSA